MKKVICESYGPPEVLKIIEVSKPEYKSDEILIKVLATAVNSGDVRIRSLNVPWGAALVIRLIYGLTKPKNSLGTVISGIIENIGSDVKEFKIGDEVYAHLGLKMGGYVEYIALPENSAVAIKPTKASFEEAASLPFGGVTALFFLHRAGIEQRKGQKVLIYGSSGAIGTAAIQLCKYYDCEVAAVCGPDGTELVKSLGADNVIIYTQHDFTKDDDKYDIIFDAVGKKSKKECTSSLAPNGRYISVKGPAVAKEQKLHLDLISKLYDSNKYRAVIDSVYPLQDIVTAHEYVSKGTKKGNVVISMDQ